MPSPLFRVQGQGCRVQGAGSGVQGAGCRVQGQGCRVRGAGCRVQGQSCSGCRVKGRVLGFREPDFSSLSTSWKNFLMRDRQFWCDLRSGVATPECWRG